MTEWLSGFCAGVSFGILLAVIGYVWLEIYLLKPERKKIGELNRELGQLEGKIAEESVK